MAETFNTKALVLNRYKYREHDSRVTVYSFDFGKIDLLARGGQKFGSKLAAHIEPLSFVNLMIIKGQKVDYVGSSIIENAYQGIKDDLGKIELSGRAINLFNRLVKNNEKDEALFNLLFVFLNLLDEESRINDCLLSAWSLKLVSLLGYRPELYNCLSCQKRIISGDNYFSSAKGGVFCSNCGKKESLGENISDDTVKILRFFQDESLFLLGKLKATSNSLSNSILVINSLINHIIN